ncbi:YbcC family protein [Alcanivorax sp. 1008]|uniref:YbcC family protein n=1 Tax=Alcanivorax sp. 1008 TaxID=2816853 RepID=UPI001DB4CABB|nr:DUF2309 domain-containing protein [Alcanivorax sp. 1008]MCC1495683.1 DUF2309 domain-containing protein [Alcanivorax sp. 1008]
MSAIADNSITPMDALTQACARIAPNWPLEQLIAVNPYWNWRDHCYAEASARLAALGHVHCLMPADYYRALWQKPVQAHHLTQAAGELGLDLSAQQLLDAPTPPATRHWYNISDLVDAERPTSAMSWHEEIVHQLSQFCGDLLQQSHGQQINAEHFYQAWLDVTRADRGLAILMDEPRLTDAFASLPNRVEDLVAQAMADLAPDAAQIGDYGVALLLDINGWASSLAWLNWQASLAGQENDALMGLLAARLAWDWILWKLHQTDHWQARWHEQWQTLPALLAHHSAQQQILLVWQRAAEIATQSQLIERLQSPAPATDTGRPALQAAFCIDVRSEVMRRALEAQHSGIQTIGFAGFFGLPLAYRPGGGAMLRPQLPGLLAPTIEVAEDNDDVRLKKAGQRSQWYRFTGSAPTTFTAVESGGLLYLFKLLRQSLFPGTPTHPVNHVAPDAHFTLRQNGQVLDLQSKASLAAGILGAMGLTTELAPRVLLIGHGSTSCNNPQAAGLDCGACGGQTGEINVRVLAQLLNDPQVRDALLQHNIRIESDTRFVAALHNTTTDEIHCFAQQADDLDESVSQWLHRASEQARRERAPALGLAASAPIHKSVLKRSQDWSQVRPEWGLAGNHSFIVAPRQRTRHLNLSGRSFLHDYNWQDDTSFSLLELIMTAPMVVTNWINMQYNASVTSPGKFGSGNKVLHNVVGGNLGVFEGNGGDLRIGLPLQSLHDGKQWIHQPLRLSVFIAAPEAAIMEVYQRHETVRQLVDNDWLYLFRLGDETGPISRLYRNCWSEAPVDSGAENIHRVA